MIEVSVFLQTCICVYIDVKVAVLLGSVAGAAAEALERAAGAQTRPAHSPTGTALRGEGRRERGNPRGKDVAARGREAEEGME